MELAAAGQLTRQPQQRAPQRADALVFFVLMPLAVAVLFSLVGIRLILGMPYLDGLGYMILHMLLAWWAVAAGAWSVRFLCRSWQPPVVPLVIMGFVFTLIPTALLFNALGDFYAGLYPVFAENRLQTARPEWSISYVAHFVRYSVPAVPLFLAGVVGYRYATGVAWLGYPQRSAESTRVSPGATRASAGEAAPDSVPRAGLVPGSRLPAAAALTAIKAEQHYVRIWSDQGADFVRFRFRDLAATFRNCHAAPVHRSWWVNFDRVAEIRGAGRSIELVMDNGLAVPVSLSHKAAVLDALDELHGGTD